MNYAEKKAYDQLKKLYSHIQGPMPRTKWGQKDHFGRWDFICVGEDRGAFIQVSEVPIYNRGKDYKEKLKDFPCPYGWRKEYWWWKKDKKMFRVWEL